MWELQKGRIYVQLGESGSQNAAEEVYKVSPEE